MNPDQMLKELRTNEAMKNGYMGTSGKFGLICRYLGQPIYSQGSLMFSQTYLEDPFALDNPEEIPYMESEQNSFHIGYHFDGLSRGINMSIVIMTHLREITCRFNGQIVYREISGELEGYVPNPMWEDKVEEFSSFASKIEKKNRPFVKEAQEKIDMAKKNQLLNFLKKKWGL